MRGKLKLDLEALSVESFEVMAVNRGRGTVEGRESDSVGVENCASGGVTYCVANTQAESCPATCANSCNQYTCHWTDAHTCVNTCGQNTCTGCINPITEGQFTCDFGCTGSA